MRQLFIVPFGRSAGLRPDLRFIVPFGRSAGLRPDLRFIVPFGRSAGLRPDLRFIVPFGRSAGLRPDLRFIVPFGRSAGLRPDLRFIVPFGRSAGLRPDLRFIVAAAISCSCASPAARTAPPAPLVVGRASAAPPPVVESPPRADLVRPCVSGSAEQRAAIAALDDLDPKIRQLRAADDLGHILPELATVLAMPCLQLAAEDNDAPLSWSDAVSLRVWWDGGYTWLRSYANLDATWTRESRRSVGTAPTIRRTLTDRTRRPEEAPLAPLLCPLGAVDDGSCGRETAGWALRAESVFRRSSGWHGRADDDIAKACEDRALGRTEWAGNSEGFSPYAVFRSCLNDLAERRTALPLGAVRAPADGWLFVSQAAMLSLAGCQENLAAYDLATGAAYLHRCTAQKHPAIVSVGRVSVAAIREAAWMSMLTDVVDVDVREHVQWFGVPHDVPLERRRGERVRPWRALVHVDDSPVRAWAWVRGRDGAYRGQVSGLYEVIGQGGAAHADELFEIADAAFVPGCAPAPPPRAIPWDRLGPSLGTPTELVIESFAEEAQAAAAIAAASPGTRRTPCSPLP